ncbi:MAG: acyl-CoA dehydrogenase family protein [Sphingomonadales bacterium]
MSEIIALDKFREFFLTEVEAAYPEVERTDSLPAPIHRRAAEIGCYRLTLPVEYGGYGMSVTEYLPYLEAAAEGPGVGRMLVHTTNGIWRPIHNFGNEEQRAILPKMAAGDSVVAFALTEMTGGTGRDLKSVARREGENWRISGEKHLITWADRADWFVLVAATDDGSQKDSLTAFLIPRDTEGFEIDATQHTMGLHGTGHAFLRYNDMAVPDKYRLGDVGQGLEVALFFLDYSRVSLSTTMVGLAQRALDEAVVFAKRRTTFGKPIAARAQMQTHIALMHADIEAARHLVRHAAKLCEEGKEFTAQAATAKLFNLNMVGRVTDLSLRVHGGWGYTKAAAIERIYRDARGFWFEEGTAEIQQLVVARHVLEKAAAA